MMAFQRYDIQPFHSMFQLTIYKKIPFFKKWPAEIYYAETQNELLDIIVEREKRRLGKSWVKR
jgi:hypothetical protein